MDAFEALKNENEALKNVIKEIDAEKIALDQAYVESLKANVQAKKMTILIEKSLNEYLGKYNESQATIAALTQQLDTYKTPITTDELTDQAA